jgi:hypothetical protein
MLQLDKKGQYCQSNISKTMLEKKLFDTKVLSCLGAKKVVHLQKNSTLIRNFQKSCTKYYIQILRKSNNPVVHLLRNSIPKQNLLQNCIKCYTQIIRLLKKFTTHLWRNNIRKQSLLRMFEKCCSQTLWLRSLHHSKNNTLEQSWLRKYGE